jgi:hypothetical protein
MHLTLSKIIDDDNSNSIDSKSPGESPWRIATIEKQQSSSILDEIVDRRPPLFH